jgi:hypothetical protein
MLHGVSRLVISPIHPQSQCLPGTPSGRPRFLFFKGVCAKPERIPSSICISFGVARDWNMLGRGLSEWPLCSEHFRTPNVSSWPESTHWRCDVTLGNVHGRFTAPTVLEFGRSSFNSASAANLIDRVSGPCVAH